MELSALAGNTRLKELLHHRVQGRGLSHAYILSGPQGSGRHTLARLLAQAMVCTAEDSRKPCGCCPQCRKAAEGYHPDIVVITGPAEGKPITVDQIRSLRADAHIRPNEAQRKVYLLEEADQMNASAQNAMLKLLEEGPAYAAFLLLAGNEGGLLETVRSRCEELSLSPVPLNECARWLRERFPEKSADEIKAAALDCQGILGRAVEALDGTENGRQARLERAAALASALEGRDELALFEAAMSLDKGEKGELIPLLDALEGELTRRMGVSADPRRLYRAVSLVKELRSGARLNANPGQLAGWLCAGMFLNDGTAGGPAKGTPHRPGPWK